MMRCVLLPLSSTPIRSVRCQLRCSAPVQKEIAQVKYRAASHQAQGRANKAAQGPGKRLGAKKSSGEYVVPGNILFRQRGTLWFPGENCYMGRDHTIHARQPGYVRYYRDPARPQRRYIGVVLEMGQTLPKPPFSVHRRRLGMLAYAAQAPVNSNIPFDAPNRLRCIASSSDRCNIPVQEFNPEAVDETMTAGQSPTRPSEKTHQLRSRSNYQYRQANWEIGKAAERAGILASTRGSTARALPDFRKGRGIRQFRQKESKRRRGSTTIPMAKMQKGIDKQRR